MLLVSAGLRIRFFLKGLGFNFPGYGYPLAGFICFQFEPQLLMI